MSDTIDPTEAMIVKAEEKLQKHMEDVRVTKKLINQLLAFSNKPPRYPDEDPAASISTTLHGDEYVDKSLTTACRAILDRRKAANLGPATIEDLYRDLLGGGYEFDTANEENSKRGVYNMLTRNTSIFHKLSNKKYGLLSWYEGVKERKKAQKGQDGDEPETGESESEEVGNGDGGDSAAAEKPAADSKDDSERDGKPKADEKAPKKVVVVSKPKTGEKPTV